MQSAPTRRRRLLLVGGASLALGLGAALGLPPRTRHLRPAPHRPGKARGA
ncbi:hypothetical protein HGA89_01275 [bacterium]|nr:hypothetical protein [bacterium]